MTKLRAFLIAIGIFIIALFALGHFVPPTTCRDGWTSSSIGQRGACSWHGGVAGNGWASLAGLASAGAAWLAYFKLVQPINVREARESQQRCEENERQRQEAEHRREKEAAPFKKLAKAHGLDCPACGAALTIRVARRGPHPGRHFLGCTLYPGCNGTRSFPASELGNISRKLIAHKTAVANLTAAQHLPDTNKR